MRVYRAGFSTSGVLAKPHAILALSVFCADTEEAAQRMASSALLSFVQLRSGRPGRMPTPDEAMAHVFTPEEQALVASYKRLQIVGTPVQVRHRIEEIVARTEADEVMIATHAADLAARIRSYELVAAAFELPEVKARAVPNPA
jgi:alkanesulfonate monooxygenase SsuD/methylene tetrahydromethanopterin reductase-like flavin-dependent oxidoreductase (luciferase family)